MQQKNERNARVQTRYDELMQEGRHGHYETMFRVVREEVERAERESKALEAVKKFLDGFSILNDGPDDSDVAHAHRLLLEGVTLGRAAIAKSQPPA
jgi:hypothetical protein